MPCPACGLDLGDAVEIRATLKDVLMTLESIDPSMISPHARRRYWNTRKMVSSVLADCADAPIERIT
jgi:hypothetical protein